MDAIRTFLEKWQVWLLGMGLLLVVDMVNERSSTASASTATETPAATQKAPVEAGSTDPKICCSRASGTWTQYGDCVLNCAKKQTYTDCTWSGEFRVIEPNCG